MSTKTQLAAAPQKTSALAVMAGKYNVEPGKLLDTLKNTVFKNATNDELLTLVVVSNEYGLNPLTKEIYAFPAKGGGIVPVVSIDGWIRMMNDHPQFDGIDYQFEHDEQGRLIACTAIIHRKDRSHPTRVTEYLAECRRNTEPWKMERRMLRHKATIQGARVAFGFSGITDEDEAAATPGLANTRDVTPARSVPIDPFAEILAEPAAPVVETEVVEIKVDEQPAEADPMDDGQLVDFLDMVQGCADAASLTKLVKAANDGFQDAKQTIAKRAINNKSKELGVAWSKKKGGFEA
jgi:phage recombination protein Bet